MVKDGNSVIHSVALGVHVDQASNRKWGIEETIGEHVGMNLLASHEVLIVRTCLKRGNTCGKVVEGIKGLNTGM